MSEILQKWLVKRLGLATDSSLDAIPHVAKDGRIFAELLYNYNVISSDQLAQVIATEDGDLRLNNLTKYVAEWLKTIGVFCSPDAFFDISRGKGTAAVKLLYQMYLVLQNKDALFFTKEQLRRSAVPSYEERFIVTRVPDEGPPVPEIIPNKYSKPLVDQRYTIQWYKDRMEALKEKCKQTREKYQQYLQEKFAKPPKEKHQKICVSEVEDKIANVEFPSTNLQTYQELVAEEEAAREEGELQPDPDKSRRHLKDIKKRNRQKAEERARKIHDQKVLLLEMWEKLVEAQRRDFDESLSKKMLQQSHYEKQMTAKMFHVRQQKENIMQHRGTLEDLVNKEKEQEFMNALLANEMAENIQKDNYYVEKQRNLELHRRLYAEKLRLKAERRYKMCMECVKDIVDLSIKHSEFTSEFQTEVPLRVRRDWGHLFIKGQPIFDLLQQPEDIVQECLEDLPEDIEEIYSIEMERQNALDTADFANYCQFEWPFDLQEYNLYDEDRLNLIEMATNILGHVVHRLLLSKYPKPPAPTPPQLPTVKVAACINGLDDLTCLPTLQKLLDLRSIRVIDLETCINYCLQAYKDEIKEEYEEATATLVAETEAALKNLDDKKKNKKERKVERKGKKKNEVQKKEIKMESELNIATSASTAVQTPRIYPGQEVVLGETAKIGRQIFEVTALGEVVPDRLVTAAFVEYLKSLQNVEGWVLVNYPSSIQQAACLEEALTAQPFPVAAPEVKVNVNDLIDEERRERPEEDKEQMRKSKLLPNPQEPVEEQPVYKTCLTAFINLKQPPDDLPEDLTELPPLNEVLGPSSDPLESFYTEQGCNYTMYYKNFDLTTTKHLAKLVIGEFTIPPKTSLELFGDTVLYVEANLKGKPGGDKPKAAKTVPKDKKPKVKKVGEKTETDTAGGGDKAKKKGSDKGKGKKGKEAPVVIVRVDKDTQAPEEEEEIVEIFVAEEAPPLPGRPKWLYADLPLGEQFEAILASYWENTEDIYITDMQQVFFTRRTLLNAVIPYVSYVNRHMEEFIRRPDDRQEHLQNFQTMYNEIDADLRDDDELKAELHCRVAEFREKLWSICDARRAESEGERRRIIAENWVSTQACQLTNNAVVMLQVELDRFVDTMQLLSDHYLAGVTRKPLDIYFSKRTLQKLQWSSSESVTRQHNTLSSATENMLTELDCTVKGTPFHACVEKAYEDALALAEEISSTCFEAYRKGAALFDPKKQKKKAKVEEPDDRIKEKAAVVLAEWKVALDGEIERLKLRLTLLKSFGEKDLEDVFTCSQKSFHRIRMDIESRYNREIESLGTACELILRAVEAEVPLQPQMTFDGDRFYVEPNVILFPEELPPPEPPLEEPDREGVFKTAQLDVLVDMLFDLAPNGLIIGRSFLFILQDMITLDAEDGKRPMVPDLYKHLTPKQAEVLLHELFGNTEFVDWKDFIVYNLCVGFPTEEELLEARSAYLRHDPDSTELIKDYQFQEVPLWFETAQSPEEAKRLSSVKHLLFKMYKINEDTLNYTALLLAFCKDEDVVRGVAKALELSLGKPVCWNKEEGDACVEALRCSRQMDEEAKVRRETERAENVEAAEGLVDELIDKTVHYCDSMVIEDLVEEIIDKSMAESSSSVRVFSSVSFLDEEIKEEVGTDKMPSPARVYFLPFETLVTVVTLALPWHARAQNITGESLRERLEVIYESCRTEEFNNGVLMHRFLNDRHFLEVIRDTFKFVAKNPVGIVNGLIGRLKDG